MNLFITFLFMVSCILFKLTGQILYLAPIAFFLIVLFYNKRYRFGFALLLFFTVFTLIPLKKDLPLLKSVKEYPVEVVKKVGSGYIVIDQEKERHYMMIADELGEGSRLVVSGEIQRLKRETFPLVFSFASYLNGMNVYTRIQIEEYEIRFVQLDYRMQIIDLLISPLTLRSQEFIKLLVFGIKNDGTSLMYDDLVDISAIHLFTVSGFHFNILYFCLTKLLSFLFKKEYLIHFLVFAFLLFYLYLLNFNIASTRGFLFLLFTYGNRIFFKKQFTRVEILSTIGIFFLLMDPFVVYSLSFLLSFVICFAMEFTSSIKFRYFSSGIHSLILSLSMIPLILYINYEFSFFAFFGNVLLSFPTAIYYFFSIIVMICPFLEVFFLPCIMGLETILSFFADFPFYITFGKVEKWFLISYYGLLIVSVMLYRLSLKKYSYYSFASIIVLLILQYCSPYFILYDTIHFLDVGQGDSILIQGSLNRYNILIDTGGNKNYDLATTKLIPYFKALGIKKLDALILSHDDFDHSGAKESLLANFPVDQVIEGNQFHQLKINDLTLLNVNHHQNCEDSNDCSNALYFEVGTISFLLTGDISIQIEEEIIHTFESLNVDILKVAHHGSKTSSSEEFISFVQPRYAIIPVGVNFYGHPSQEVIDRLIKWNATIYTTKEQGSVIFKIFQNQINITLYNP